MAIGYAKAAPGVGQRLFASVRLIASYGEARQ
jgi:hypothetical protein